MYSNRFFPAVALLLFVAGEWFSCAGLANAQALEAPLAAPEPPAQTDERPGEPPAPAETPGAAPQPNQEQPAEEPAPEEPKRQPPQKPKPDSSAGNNSAPEAEQPNPKQPEGKQGQDDDKKPENEKPETKKADSKKDAPKEDDRPAPPWDEKIEKVLSQKYPKSVDDLRIIQNQVRAVVEYARPATVGVRIGGAVGSGIVVNEDGLVLTAGHVAMEPNKRVTFFFANGKRARGVTLGVNRAVDSGMMRITDKGPWPYVPMGSAGANKPGNWVVGLGQPNGFFPDRAPPVRLGRVLFGDKRTICTDVTLVGGDSGGPLFNLKGEVVGIHSRIGRRITSNFHIPIDQYHMTWDRLAGGEMWGGRLGASEPARHRPFLGLAGNSLKGRCEITQVYLGMPADRAGIKPGDVVTRFGDDQVESFDDLKRLVLAHKINARVKVMLERDGKPVELQVRLMRIAVGFPGAPKADKEKKS